MTKTPISEIKYHHFGGIADYYMDKTEGLTINDKLFGTPIYWQRKYDGENVGCYLDDEGELQVRTREMDKIEESERQKFLALPCAANIKRLLHFHEQIPGVRAVLFGEFIRKGKSPKLIEIRDENNFVAFDLYLSDENTTPHFVTYGVLQEYCINYEIPCAELMMVQTVTSLEEILATRDSLIAKCKEYKYEGVVGKVWVTNENGTFVNMVKEKTVLPKVRSPKDPNNQLPDLSESEITGAIEKALFELGEEKFKDEIVAMPVIGRYVKEQCQKHKCRNPGSAYILYKARIIRL